MKKVMMSILFATFWLVATFALVAIPAAADVKCGRAPIMMSATKKSLALTWAGSAPNPAKITLTNSNIFSTVAEVTGSEIPQDFPAKYSKNLITATIFDLVDKEQNPASIFEGSFRQDNVMFGAIVEYPNVANPEQLSACSVVLQRAVIVYDNDGTSRSQETLFLRDRFHSAKDSANFVNFVPGTGIQLSFPSENIWFPLEQLEGTEEPASYVVLDILTPQQLSYQQLPKPFQLEKTAQMQYQGKSYSVARITAKLAAGHKLTELRLEATPVEVS
jgi:hypothetical protein